MYGFRYVGEIKTIQFYDMTNPSSVLERKIGGGKRLVLVGNIISEVEYHDGMFLPQVGMGVRFDSGKYDGIYNVTEWVYCDATKLLRIKVKKT